MIFDTKIAIVVRNDLEAWQKLNVTAFLAGGIAAAFPECIGAPYLDGSGTVYHSIHGATDLDLWRRQGRVAAGARPRYFP